MFLHGIAAGEDCQKTLGYCWSNVVRRLPSNKPASCACSNLNPPSAISVPLCCLPAVPWSQIAGGTVGAGGGGSWGGNRWTWTRAAYGSMRGFVWAWTGSRSSPLRRLYFSVRVTFGQLAGQRTPCPTVCDPLREQVTLIHCQCNAGPINQGPAQLR